MYKFTTYLFIVIFINIINYHEDTFCKIRVRLGIEVMKYRVDYIGPFHFPIYRATIDILSRDGSLT